MNREVHVRFWESPEVKVLRATRQSRRFDPMLATSGTRGPDIIRPIRHVSKVPLAVNSQLFDQTISALANGHRAAKLALCRKLTSSAC